RSANGPIRLIYTSAVQQSAATVFRNAIQRNIRGLDNDRCDSISEIRVDFSLYKVSFRLAQQLINKRHIAVSQLFARNSNEDGRNINFGVNGVQRGARQITPGASTR